MTERERDLFGLDLSAGNEPEHITFILISMGDVGDSEKFSETEHSAPFLLPASQISIRPTEGLTRTTSKLGHPKYPYVQVRMPVSLAKDRGLV